jgi:putative DNA primase/helicase
MNVFAPAPLPFTGSGSPAASELHPIAIDALLALEIPRREMLLDPILPTQGLAMAYAPRGLGKTWFTQALAYAIACGGPFLKWSAPAPRRVLYVDGEMPANVMRERFAQIVQAAKLEPPAPDYLRLITPDLEDTPLPDISRIEGQDALQRYLEGVDLLVLDNLSTLCRSGRENEAESWEPVQQWLLTLRRMGVSVLMVHHAGKGGQQRGTSRREDVLDTVINLRRPYDYQPDEGARFEVHLEKARGITGDTATPFEARLDVRDNQATWSWRDLADRQLEEVRRLSAENCSLREIAEITGISKSSVQRLLAKAREGTG